jgi:LacI family repressor for deo operon, udp, cdd, tsx, nupC, and nupG
VSVSTISRAVSSPDKVNAETRSRILSLIAELGYAPNAAASNLRQARTRRLLAVVPTIGSSFFASLLESVEQTAITAGYTMLVGSLEGSAEMVERYAAMLPRHIVDGTIVFGGPIHPSLRQWSEARSGVPPVVTVLYPNSHAKVSSVSVDDVRCGYDAMDYLFSLGHRRIGVIAGPSPARVVEERLKGALKHSKAFGYEADVRVEYRAFSYQEGASGAARLLSYNPRPTALFCMSDSLAIGASNYARHIGLSLPADLSVVGFGDIEFARFMKPALTTVSVPLRDIGREAARLLIDILERDEIRAPIARVLPHHLEIRDSVTAPS